ncbi:unnamed protein product [Chilo suppressalis]|uniref:FLYWCH-type domain-containing protein n=1 Tax=Chilo suppressalis TaxID=168631 RepID=A0ABN8B153_CHISP|nr:unnamed protein product [Chilo suppressalis]
MVKGYKYSLQSVKNGKGNQYPIYKTGKVQHTIIDGFKFSVQRSKKKRFRWRCVKQRDGCKACFSTFNNFIYLINNEHNHRPLICRYKYEREFD